MIKAIALDDEPPALELIKKYCGQTGYINLLKTFTKTDEAARYIANYPVDLLFLDINMPAVTGLKFRQLAAPGTMVIFATAYSEFAVEGFNLNALDYLLKPFDYKRFLQAAEKAKAKHKFIYQNPLCSPQNISLRVDYSLMKVQLSSILYIEGMDDYIRIYMRDQKPVITRMTMKALEKRLPGNEFARIHRSYIVPVNKIDFVRNKVVHIDKYRIPVGICYKEKFYHAINNSSGIIGN
ncbi:MAG: LytTR family DNA-binding domain-containing protein [Chitinophagaceae bacterium]